MPNLKSSKFVVSAAAFLYVLVLQWAYVNVISPTWAYTGHDIKPRPLYLVIVAFSCACLPALLTLPSRLQRPSQALYLLLYALAYVPTLIVGSFKAGASAASFAVFMLVLTGCFLGLGIVHRLPLARLPTLSLPAGVFWPLIFGFSLASYAYLAANFSLHLAVESIIDVYDVRADFKDTAQASGTASLTYAVHWNAYVVNPFYIGYGIARHKLWLVAIGVVGQLAIFSFTGFKQVFFSGLLIAALVFGVKRYRGRFSPAIILGFVGVIATAVVADHITGSLVMKSIFVRRLIAVPGVMTFNYWEFFSEHELARLGYTFLSPLFDYPYDLPPQNMIGLVYLDSPGTSANANVWADAYANFGYLGMFVFTIVLATVMWFFDSVARRQDLVLATLLLTVPAFGLVNSALFSTLLTHGIGAGVALAMVRPISRRGSEPVKDPRQFSTTNTAFR